VLNNQDHLTLRLARLKSPEELDQKGEGVVFVFAKGGAGKFTSPTTTRRVSAGEILVFDGTAGGKLAADDSQGEFLFWLFSVCFENLLPLFAGNEISLLHNITEGFKASKIYPANSPLAVECQRLLGVVPPQFNLDHRGQLIRIAASILSLEFKDAQSQRGGYVRAEDHMVQVFEKLSASELINLSVGELADRFSCSRRHLNRLFHQHFGVSVASLRMEMRLLKAISLLRDHNAKIINVAEQCGFNHLGLFNTCFKRRFGASPGQWRKSALDTVASARKPEMSKPVCPLHTTGLCPLGSSHEVSLPDVMATFTGNKTGGVGRMKDMKSRDLGFGVQSPSNIKRNAPGARAGE
jgi:AraC-like DNA-binding protein